MAIKINTGIVVASLFMFVFANVSNADFLKELKDSVEKTVKDSASKSVQDVTKKIEKKIQGNTSSSQAEEIVKKKKKKKKKQKKEALAEEVTETEVAPIPSDPEESVPHYPEMLVAHINEELAKLGYSQYSEIDKSSYDERSRLAIEKYQEDYGLKIDGKPTLDLFYDIRNTWYSENADQTEPTSSYLELPWTIITLNMTPEVVEKNIKDAGMEGRCGKNRCIFSGKWLGEWMGKINVSVHKGEIVQLVFDMHYPTEKRSHVENHLLKTVAGGRQSSNCGPLGAWEYKCTVKNTTESIAGQFMIKENETNNVDFRYTTRISGREK